MVITMTYKSPSGVKRSRRATNVNFSANSRRDEVFFKGRLKEPISFREAIGALHDVTIADLKWKPDPKKKADYAKWRKEQIAKYDPEFWRLQRGYFEYIYKNDFAQWRVLDPVITVHPDQVFFEAFSKDESSYGRLAAKQTLFEGVEKIALGTTNVDFSANLYREMQALRSYRNTDFTIDPSGIGVQTGGRAAHTEKRIDLPDTWIRGFMSVQSAMLLPKATTVELDPIDVMNLCVFMRRHREWFGPRSLRWELTPGKHPEVVIEPWNVSFVSKRSIYTGSEPRSIRTWGRRRLHLMERLLPFAKKFTVTLLGRGLPSFYHCDLGDMVFTLGLSGWTTNNWTGSTNFGLFFAQQGSAERTKAATDVLAYLKTQHRATLNDIAQTTNTNRDIVLDALKLQCQAGKVMYDFGENAFRYRPVLKEEIPLNTLMYRDPKEAEALKLVLDGHVKLQKPRFDDLQKRTFVQAEVKEGAKTYHPELVFDVDGRLITATSDDYFFKQNKLYQGPSTPILAAKIAHERREALEDYKG